MSDNKKNEQPNKTPPPPPPPPTRNIRGYTMPPQPQASDAKNIGDKK